MSFAAPAESRRRSRWGRSLFNWRRWRNRKAADPAFQAWAAGTPVARGFARRDGEKIFDLMAGFVYTQSLAGLVELGVLDALREAEATPATLAAAAGAPLERMRSLLDAGVALEVLEERAGTYGLSRLGAALAGAPGLVDLIRHHSVLYRDMADPAAFFRGEVETELADFWPYVFGAAAADDPNTASRYSDLMAKTQAMVAADTLAAVDLSGARRLMDVGGGTGVFLAAAAQKHAHLEGVLFDLPAVAPEASARFAGAGLAERIDIVGGSFRDDPLPAGADVVSLVRVLYDHEDETVRKLLAAVRAALPPGGRVIVSEPMRGAAGAANRSGDVYFAAYCMAMRTGRARSPEEIETLLEAAGFHAVRRHRTRRAFVTTAIEAVNPA